VDEHGNDSLMQFLSTVVSEGKGRSLLLQEQTAKSLARQVSTSSRASGFGCLLVVDQLAGSADTLRHDYKIDDEVDPFGERIVKKRLLRELMGSYDFLGNVEHHLSAGPPEDQLVAARLLARVLEHQPPESRVARRVGFAGSIQALKTLAAGGGEAAQYAASFKKAAEKLKPYLKAKKKDEAAKDAGRQREKVRSNINNVDLDEDDD